MAPVCNAEVLSSIPKCKKTVKFVTEKIHVLSELPSDMSYYTPDLEFSVNHCLSMCL